MVFKALKDMARTISRNKVKQIEVLGNPGNASRSQELYDGIVNGTFNSYEEAAQHFFGTNDIQDTRFRKLKNKLIRQLINTSLFVDINQPMFNERAKAYYNCYRDFAAAHLLTLREASLAAITLFEQILEQSIKYELIDLTADVARELRKLYARGSGDAAKHERIALIHRQYEEKRRLEMLALEHYENLIHYYIVRRSPNEEVHQYASTYFDELLPLAKQVDTSQYYFYTYSIGIIRSFAANDCATALQTCEECLSILKTKKNTNRAALAAISNLKIACLTQLKLFDLDCDESVKYSLSQIEDGTINWFRTHELHLHYCLFAKRYQDALDIYAKTSRHEKFSTLAGTASDNWQLYAGYLHLLAALGKLDPEEVKTVVGEFQYADINKHIDILDRDKHGMNIPLVLLPILYALATGTFIDADISIEALEQYRKRYLNNDMNRRSEVFLSMLIAFTKKDFRSESVARKIKKELEVLASIQPQVAGQTYAVEVIPYEDLWEMITA